MTPTITMLCGLPASGKSTWAKDNADKLNAEIHSSDKLREELYGDESIQGDSVKLFEELHRRMKKSLEEGSNVIYDATNISKKRRVHFNKEFIKYNREVVYFDTHYEICVINDRERKRTVGKDVLTKMFKALQIPTYAEGWNNINIIHDLFYDWYEDEDRKNYESLLLNGSSYEELFGSAFETLFDFNDIRNIIDLPQDNPHHTFSVSRHTYHVYKYVYENYYNKENSEDFLKMLWVAILHDVGKYYTKDFLNHKGEPTIYAHFYGHENCSAQIAVTILHSLGYDDSFILDVAELVQLHMKLLDANEKTKNKLEKSVKEDVFDKLLFFIDADTSAK